MRFKITICLLAGFLCCLPLIAQGDPKAEIQQGLLAQFSLTTPTADLADIVTAGSVVTLKKPGLLMYTVTYHVPIQNTYKSGKLIQTFGANFSSNMKLNRVAPGVNNTNVQRRMFVPGEKFWVTGVTVLDDGVVIQVYSDPYSDGRYFGEVKFPYQKNAVPSVNQMVNTVSEVFEVEGGPPAQQQQPVRPPLQQVHETAPVAPPPPIAPPPPPPDAAPPETKTIAIGQTKAQVAGIFGPPQKVVKLGNKEIHYYPDMKVTFVNGRVSNVE